MGTMQELLNYLRPIPQGPIADGDALASVLASCWEEFEGASAEGMEPDKLHGRMEDIVWESPVLSFMLERHGDTVYGSTRAKLQCWQVNLETQTATCGTVGHRQLKPMKPKLNVKPLAEKIARLIIEGCDDNGLKWNADGSVRVLIGNVIPALSAVKQTLQDRRRRFRTELEALLTIHGWWKVTRDCFKTAVRPYGSSPNTPGPHT
jgi:hypothetical protein